MPYYDPEQTIIDCIGLQDDAMSVEVCTDNPMIDTDIRLLHDTLSREGERLGERFRVLADMLLRQLAPS